MKDTFCFFLELDFFFIRERNKFQNEEEEDIFRIIIKTRKRDEKTKTKNIEENNRNFFFFKQEFPYEDSLVLISNLLLHELLFPNESLRPSTLLLCIPFLQS
jgi:hypothetical protein